MAFIGEALISKTIDMLMDQLASSAFVKFAREEPVLRELSKWKSMLPKIKAVLKDAEEKQMTDPSVRDWLDELRDLAYDAEDFLDEFATELLRRKVTQETEASTSQVPKVLCGCFSCLNPKTIKFNVEMGSKLEEITNRLQDIVTQQNTMNLVALTVRKDKKAAERTPTTSAVNKDHVFGRENDKKAIFEVLKSEATYERSNVCVMPIWGMGGLGKTTLAQLIYDDDSLKVDVKGWICVSEDFSVLRITKTILYKVASRDAGDLDSLQKELKTILLGKKFLIVLDDIWDMSYNDWNLLLCPLQVGAPGSVIIVTTRFEDIAKMTGTVQAHSLGTLNKDDCVSILAQHALGATNFDSHPNLKETGEQIAHRCKGLPLAARTLGGLLHNNLNLRDWKTVWENRIWDFQEGKNEIPLALRLSYYYLPSHLKRCFAYCAVFPKDYEFSEDGLVQLWMAEGFLEGSKTERDMENLCRQYFSDLCSRSFFQKNKSQFIMHDFIHDLAQDAARDSCYNFEEKVKVLEPPNTPDKVRYFAFSRTKYDVSTKFAILSQMKSLRTFLALRGTTPTMGWNYLSGNVLRELLPNMRYLRSLSLAFYEIDEVPDRIGDLKHLRYLNFSYTEIKCLPESVGNLFNLETLLLQGCRSLTKLPSSIGNLINLQFLDISGTNHLLEVPQDIGKLKSLKSLQKFTARNCKGLGIGELSRLRKLSVSGLDNVDVRNASTVKLNSKSGLEELEMIWSDDVHDSGNERDRYHILDSLKPHTRLQVLKITCYGATRFPYWIGDPSFSNLKEVTLCNCRRTSLPPLGRLPSLRNLKLEGMDEVETVGDEFYGNVDAPFPSLLSLQICNMPRWKKWSFPSCVKGGSGREFSLLLKLHISNCPELVGRIPQHLPSLADLKIDTCPQLASLVDTGDLPSLQRLDVSQCSEVIFKGNMVGLPNLKHLRLERVSEITCLNKRLVESLVALETLDISSCKRLTSIWEDGTDIEKLLCLTRLKIHQCLELETLSGGEEGQMPLNLKYLNISFCEKLEKLPNGLCSLTSLEVLKFYMCPKLKCFPASGLPCSLKTLEVFRCEALESLPEGILRRDSSNNNISSQLQFLVVKFCPSVAFSPISELPASLKYLDLMSCKQLTSLSSNVFGSSIALEKISIDNCENLRSLTFERIDNLEHLKSLCIYYCKSLESFPESVFSLPNLGSLDIRGLGSLKLPPIPMHRLMSLRELSINDCPGLETLTEDGLPPNLTSLTVGQCENLKQPMSEWGLHRLTSLSFLLVAYIRAPEMVSFPDEEGLLLPTSLTTILIWGIHNLQSLSKGLLNLTSLSVLFVQDCPKLHSLPKEGLPESLGELQIENCPLLQEQCLQKKGKYWDLIRNIPCLKIASPDI